MEDASNLDRKASMSMALMFLTSCEVQTRRGIGIGKCGCQHEVVGKAHVLDIDIRDDQVLW